MNKRRFWILIAVVSLLMILVFLVAGCRGEVTLEGTAKKEAVGKEEPDKELFSRYFSDIGLGGLRGFFVRTVDENVNTFLPHQEGSLYGGFKNKENFTFRTAVLDLETNGFVKRCADAVSSEGADGFSMEILEWKFLRPGSYEYRVYVEDTLVAVLPFEVISYFDYFRTKDLD
jgi:hypothetical protein